MTNNNRKYARNSLDQHFNNVNTVTTRLCEAPAQLLHILEGNFNLIFQEVDGPPQKRYLDFLDILLTAKDDTGMGLTPLEIRSEVDTFLFEGRLMSCSSHRRYLSRHRSSPLFGFCRPKAP